MNIFFQDKNFDLHASEKEFMANRMYNLRKFFSPYAQAYIDVERTRASMTGDDLYRITIRLDDGPHRYFTEEFQRDVRTTFDHAYGDIFRMVRNERSRSRTMARRAQERLKRLFKKSRY